MRTRSEDLTQADVVIDLRAEVAAEDDDDDGGLWVTLDEAVDAAELSGIGGAAVHEWHRAGLLPTRRAEGDGGAVLVELGAVQRFGAHAGEPLFDVDTTYWSIAAIEAREETVRVRDELDEARRQVDFLREQLAESAGAERATAARLEAAEAELASLRSIVAATSSITDSSWLGLATNRYESPVRPQGMAAPIDATVIEPEEDEPVIDLDDVAPPRVEHPKHGLHKDDLLPSSAGKGRRGRR